jgi:hypothetical protein
MRQPGAISEYLDTLTRELSFDIPLARRVRQEVEDHLWEAVAAEPGAVSIEAQHRAIRSFGNPRAIASEYAAPSLFRQTRRVGAILILVVAGILIAMWGRVTWSGMMHWGWSADLREVSGTVLLIDRYAFKIAFAICVIGWGYIGSRRVATNFHAAYGGQLRRCLLLCAMAAVALLASVIADVTLTVLRIFDTGLQIAALVPLVLLAAEITFAGVLVVQLRKTVRGAALAYSRFCI